MAKITSINAALADLIGAYLVTVATHIAAGGTTPIGTNPAYVALRDALSTSIAKRTARSDQDAWAMVDEYLHAIYESRETTTVSDVVAQMEVLISDLRTGRVA